ncbi:hypothetical protein BGW39_001087 [Mortierella sp. 14UC]|nr:hypothetical protein BGW39_001087 [Mortierella sp. 14UC]
MATPHHHYVHDSEDNTSDSNEEFASASEGDDDLPWEPVVIRSPIISRQSPVSPAPQVETPRPAHATTTIHTSSSSSSSSIATATTITTTSTTTRTLTASSPFGHQHQQQQQQYQDRHSFDQGGQEYLHYEQQSIAAAPHHHVHHGQEQEWEQGHHQQQQQQQWTSTTQVSSASPRTHHAHREFSSSSSSSTRSQGSPSQTLRGAAPKLRERMRQSPVLHSRIVQAYLDPSASQGQRQQQQHVSSENVRQAWLQDHRNAHQESSEDDTEDEQEQERRQTAPICPTPTHAPVPVYQHPVVPLPAAVVTAVPSSESLLSANQHHTEHSWNEADTEDYVDHVPSGYDHHHDNNQEEGAWGFDESIDIEGGAPHGVEQVEEARGFDEPIDIEDSAQPAEPAVDAAWGFDGGIDIEGGAQSGEQQTEDAWGFDDDIQVEEHVQDQHSYTESAQSFNDNAHIHETVQPATHHDKTPWGFDDNLHVEETVQPDLDQVEAAWGFDDNIDIEGGIHIHTEDHSAEAAAAIDETLRIDEVARLDQHQEGSAWGFDDDIQINEPAQSKPHQNESAPGFVDTIDIVTSTPLEQTHQESTADVRVRASVDESAGSDSHVGASWGFEDKIEIGDTPQVEHIESSWGFDEPLAVEVVNEPESAPTNDSSATAGPAPTDDSSASAEPSYPAMHQAHESDADAWDYDDQVIELVEEAVAQEVHSSSFAANVHDALDHQDYQQPHVNKTDDSFSEHVAMPPSSATPSTGDYEDRQELSEVVDRDHRAEHLVQGQHSYADQSIDSTFDHNDNLHHHTTSGETHGIDSAGPSEIVDEAVAEQSWGFDMDEVIGGDLESANPFLGEYEQAIVQERYQPEEPHVVPTTTDNSHHQAEQELFVPSTIEETADVEGIEAVIEGESKHVDQASDDEHDSEVREVLFATQLTPVAIPGEAQGSEISPFATNSRAHSRSSVSFEDSKPYYADAAVTSHLLVKENAASLHRSDSRGSVGELKRSVSDSEGSDIYGDLSTAYTGRNMSSNRLNELLEDDDYLEHMERGVPMDRSISTPFSDDETPKFVMEDDAAELMERGEPQSVGGVPSDHLETLEDEQDVLPCDNQAVPSAPDSSTDAAGNAPLSDLALPIANDTSSQSLPDAVADTATEALSPEAETNVVEDEADPSFAEVAKTDISEPEPTTTVETVDVVSDDRDPANPFSDAAAIDDSDLWPNTEPLLEKEELSSEIHFGTTSQESAIDVESLSHAKDEGLEDAWADQGLDVVVEPSSTLSVSDIHDEVKSEEIQPAMYNAYQDIIDGLDGDAWGDQELDTVENALTAAPVILNSVEAPVHHQESIVVEHHEPQSVALVEPEQPLVESSVDVQAAAEPGPIDDSKERADVDDSEEIAVKDMIVEAEGDRSLLDAEKLVIPVDEVAVSHQTDTLTTPLKQNTLEEDAWDNQADALDIDTALEEDAWADQEDLAPADVPAPVVPAVVHLERSVSDLFADKGDQPHSKPVSPVRAFNASPTHAFGFSTTRSSTTSSPVREFAAFAPKSPQERSVSDLFSGKSEQPDVKSDPRRGFAAFAATSCVIQKQESSVSDLFFDTPVQHQPVKPSTPVPAPVPSHAPVQEDLLKDTVEEDAWSDQDILIDEVALPAVNKSVQELEPEREPEQEPEPVETTLDIAQSIDDALEGDAWSDDQDIEIEQEVAPIAEEPHVDTAVFEVQEVLQHVTPTLEQSSESHSSQGPQEPTQAYDIDQSIEAAIEDDAWDNQDDVVVESTFPPMQELEKELPQEPLHTLLETTPVEDFVQEDTYKHREPTADALSIDHPLEAALEEDAWDNQDDTTFGQELDAHQDHQSIERAQALVQSEDTVVEDNRSISAEEFELDDAIDAAMEEDMWADNDMPTFSEPPVQSQTHIGSTIAEVQSIKDSPTSDKVEEPKDQPIFPSLESPALPTPTDAEGESHLDKALEDDAWNDQDVDKRLDTSEHVPTAQDTRVDTEQESQDRTVEESQERPSLSGSRIGSIIHQSNTMTAAEIVEDAWGWDEDETEVSLEYEQDAISPSQNDATAFAQDDQHDGEHNQALSASDSEEVTTAQEKTMPDAHSPAQIATETPGKNLFPLAIQKERLAAETDSGEGEADSATQSSWQDISPASVSKRSEAGMSIGSEFESEYSVRSLDDDGHVSPALDGQATHERESCARSAETGAEPKKGLETTMSWTDLKDDDDAWNDDLPETGPVNPPVDSKEPSDPIKEGKNSAEVQPLPDISGADSWDFDQDDDLQSETALSFAGLTPTSTRASFSRSVKTPGVTESRSFGSLSSPQNKTPTFSSMTSLPGQVLSSYQSSIAGSTPVSPSHATGASAGAHSAAAAAEVEDDSHLPVAIRQQRARLAARGKPLPPISNSAASPRLATATSPTISFASPAKVPVSPMLNPTPVAAAADQKFLSPALQKQRERLEKKRAASAAAAAAPLSAASRLAPLDSSSFANQFSSSSNSSSSLYIAPVKPTSPLIKEATLHSAMKHTSTSPTTVRKSVQLADRAEPAAASAATTTSPSTFSAEEFGRSTRRRGLSISSNQSGLQSSTSPSTPTAEGVVSRRSKEVHRPSMFSSASATTTPTSATFSEAEGKSNVVVVKSTQNNALRHVSRLSMSSSTSGSGWDDTPDEDVWEKDDRGWNDKKALGKGVDRKESVVSRPTILSSTSSSSFYQQSVPGLDDDDFGVSNKKSSTVVGGGSSSFTGSNTNTTTTTTTATSTSSSYLSSKKADDYDPYGPMASRSKAKSSFDGDRDSSSYPEANEILIGRSAPSPGVSLLSPSSATSMSHRHDPHHHQHRQSGKFGGAVVKDVSSQSSSSGGFFGGGGGGGSGSLVGDISSLLQEKKNPAPTTTSNSSGFGAGANLGSDYEPKNNSSSKPSPASKTPSAVQQKQQQALPKSSSWSFGSWVSSAVAAATEKIDQAYESLDPEYSRMKAQSPSMAHSNASAGSSTGGGAGGEGGAGGDPNSLSPFKKPGYVVGGSSLALGLASISTGPAGTGGSSSGGAGVGPVSPQTPHRPSGGNKRNEDEHESFASAGTESDLYGAHLRSAHTSESLSPRLTRKNVSGR